jgi:hypothetical protein
MDSFTIPFCVLIHYLIFGHCAALDETATILPDQMLLNDGFPAHKTISCFSHGFFLTKTVSLCPTVIF